MMTREELFEVLKGASLNENCRKAMSILQDAVGDSLRERGIGAIKTHEMAELFASVYAAFIIGAIEYVGDMTGEDEKDAQYIKKELTRYFMTGFQKAGVDKKLIPKLDVRFINPNHLTGDN